MTDGWGWRRSDPLRTPAAPTVDHAARLQPHELASGLRAVERVESTQARIERRAAERAAAAEERDKLRASRRVEDAARREAQERGEDVGDTGPAKRRRSGSLSRTGEVQKERDTRGYRTVVDHDRLIALAKRGASVGALAGSFGLSIEEVEAVLAATE